MPANNASPAFFQQSFSPVEHLNQINPSRNLEIINQDFSINTSTSNVTNVVAIRGAHAEKDSKNSEHETKNTHATSHISHISHTVTETIEGAGILAELAHNKIVHTSLKPAEKVIKGVTFFDDYNLNKNNGNSTVASIAGAVAGVGARSLMQSATLLQAAAAQTCISSGVGMFAAPAVATGAVHTFNKTNEVGQAASSITANAIDVGAEFIANSKVHYQNLGLCEAEVLLREKLCP
jgi:hypothetical protein